jgi:hypothetical protein
MLIAKQNLFPTLMLLLPGSMSVRAYLGGKMHHPPMPIATVGSAEVYLFDDVMKVTWKIRRERFR